MGRTKSHAAASPTLISGTRWSCQTEKLRVTPAFASAWDSAPRSQIRCRRLANSPR